MHKFILAAYLVLFASACLRSTKRPADATETEKAVALPTLAEVDNPGAKPNPSVVVEQEAEQPSNVSNPPVASNPDVVNNPPAGEGQEPNASNPPAGKGQEPEASNPPEGAGQDPNAPNPPTEEEQPPIIVPPPPPPPAPAITYSSSIAREVFATHCLRCHSTSARRPRKPLMDSYEDVIKVIDLIHEAAVEQVDYMPPGPPAGLPEETRLKLKAWIEAGAPKE